MNEKLTTQTTPEVAQQTAAALNERFRLQGENMIALGFTPEDTTNAFSARFSGVGELEATQNIDSQLVDSLKREITSGRSPSDRYETGADSLTHSSAMVAAERDIAVENYVHGSRKPSNYYDAALRVARGISLDGSEVSSQEVEDGRAAVALLEKPELYDAIGFAIAQREADAVKGATPPGETPSPKHLSREDRAKFDAWRQQVSKGSEGLSQLDIPSGLLEEGVRVYSDDLQNRLNKLHQEGRLDEEKALALQEIPGVDALKLALSGGGDSISRNVTLAARSARQGKAPVDEVTFRHSIHSLETVVVSGEQTEQLRASMEQIDKRLGGSAIPELVQVQFV